LRKVLQDWTRTLRNDLSTWSTQEGLKSKYHGIAQRDELHRQLQDNAEMKWQWPKLYRSIAGPLPGENWDELEYDIDQSWKAMRTRHAKECWEWIQEHQIRCTDFFQNHIQPENALRTVLAETENWLAEHPGLYGPAMQSTTRKQVEKYTELIYRLELPKATSKHKKEKELMQKREQEILEAEADYQKMDMKELLAVAVLEAQQGKGNRRQKGVLHHLLKENPEALKKYHHALKEKPHHNTPPTKPRSTSRTARPSSRTSAKQVRTKSASSKGSSRPRSASSKGKGKGKGKRKSKDKSKGRGKGREGRGRSASTSSRRSATPHPRRRS